MPDPAVNHNTVDDQSMRVSEETKIAAVCILRVFDYLITSYAPHASMRTLRF